MSFSILLKICQNHLYKNFNPYSWGDCNEINCSLVAVAKILGYEAQAMVGYVRLDIPLEPQSLEEGQGVYDPRHCWAVINGQIVDLATQQFEGHAQVLEYKKGRPINEEEFSQKELVVDIIQEFLEG